jgi:hypothetical protein
LQECVYTTSCGTWRLQRRLAGGATESSSSAVWGSKILVITPSSPICAMWTLILGPITWTWLVALVVSIVIVRSDVHVQASLPRVINRARARSSLKREGCWFEESFDLSRPRCICVLSQEFLIRVGCKLKCRNLH